MSKKLFKTLQGATSLHRVACFFIMINVSTEYTLPAAVNIHLHTKSSESFLKRPNKLKVSNSPWGLTATDRLGNYRESCCWVWSFCGICGNKNIESHQPHLLTSINHLCITSKLFGLKCLNVAANFQSYFYTSANVSFDFLFWQWSLISQKQTHFDHLLEDVSVWIVIRY